MKDRNLIRELFSSELVCINIGPKLMGEALEKQGIKVIQVDWRPATEEDREMQDLLDELGGF